MELIKVDPKEYGLEEIKAKEISNLFIPMLEKMEELESEYNQIQKESVFITPEICSKAKELKQKYVKVRTGTAKIHKELKAFYLNGGRFVDGWKNTQLMASQGIEQKLDSIANHFENLEKEKIRKKQDERAEQIRPYTDAVMAHLGEMDEETWNAVFLSIKQNHLDKKNTERIAAEEKAKADEAERIRVKKIEEENAVLRAKQAEEEKALKDAQDKIKAQELAQKQKLDAEEKARQAELSKGDNQKVIDLMNDLNDISKKYSFESEKNQRMFENVQILINKTISYISERK